jgi:cytochrome P450
MDIPLYNIHRDERFWPNVDTFDPEQFTQPYKNPDIPEWNGFDPEKWNGELYPHEIESDFAFLPFGGGARKCVGNGFAVMEAAVILAMVLWRFDFEFDPSKSTSVDLGLGSSCGHENGSNDSHTKRSAYANQATRSAGEFLE